jgi:hypothetical protein
MFMRSRCVANSAAAMLSVMSVEGMPSKTSSNDVSRLPWL